MLDNRLKKCAELVSGRGIAVDVGTDHAYLAAELITSGKCGRVIASDINEGPLDSARKTVEKYGVSDKVELILSDGLENVPLDGVTDVVIAGMGGETIIDILDRKFSELEGKNLILQPMTKPELLRKWLYSANIAIDREYGVQVGERLYTVMKAEQTSEPTDDLTEFEALAGFFDDDDEVGKKYRKKESERLARAADNLKKSGKINDAVHYGSLSRRLVNGVEAVSIEEIYRFLDEKYPFSLQEKWDNSGFLVENREEKCRKLLLTLDITNDAVYEAVEKRAELIISHHPVIFEPLRRVKANSPVYRLVRNNIAAICMHTNLDIAQGGTNSVIVEKIGEKLEISDNIEPLEDSGLGCIIEFLKPVDSDRLADVLKEIFGLDRIRMSGYGEFIFSKIAICSGSGGSLWRLAREKGCDALITGDVKHDVWIDSNNECFTVIDCGHFHTENLVLWELRRVLEERFPLLDVEISERSVDPCCYL